MSTWDSKHNFKLPRWGTTSADGPTDYVAEPPTQQQDDGWTPGVSKAVGEWWNWLHQQAYYWFRWAENIWSRRWPDPQVMRTAKGTIEGQVTAGSGLSVNVAACRVLLNGAMYQVPAATNLALAAADATNPRFDLVVAQLNGLVPEFAVITGTPAANPVEPTPGAGQAAIGRVRVNAAASAPGTIVDRRVFGILGVNKLEVSGTLAELDVGESGRTLKVLDQGGSSPSVTLFENSDGLPTLQIYDAAGNPELTWFVGAGLTVDLTGAVTIEASGAVSLVSGGAVTIEGSSLTLDVGGSITIPPPSFSADVTQKLELAADAFQVVGTSLAYTGNTVSAAPYWVRNNPGLGIIRAPVVVPIGATITEVRVVGSKTTADAHVQVRLAAITKNTNTRTDVVTFDNDGSSTGGFALAETGIGKSMVDNEALFLEVAAEGGSGEIRVWAAEVVYTFDSL